MSTGLGQKEERETYWRSLGDALTGIESDVVACPMGVSNAQLVKSRKSMCLVCFEWLESMRVENGYWKFAY